MPCIGISCRCQEIIEVIQGDSHGIVTIYVTEPGQLEFDQYEILMLHQAPPRPSATIWTLK